MWRLICMASVLGLAGCSTSPVPAEKAKPIPIDRALAANRAFDGSALVVVTRDGGLVVGGGCYVAVLIDGKLSARIGTGERAEFYVAPGRHIVGMSGDPDGRGLCGLQIGQPIKETATELVAGETQRFRISGDTSSGLDIRPTSF